MAGGGDESQGSLFHHVVIIIYMRIDGFLRHISSQCDHSEGKNGHFPGSK